MWMENQGGSANLGIKFRLIMFIVFGMAAKIPLKTLGSCAEPITIGGDR